MASLSIQNVCKTYGNGVEVLKGINLEVPDGGFLILVGGSGCGKSTLLNMIAGLETVSSGQLLIGNRRVNELSPKDRDIAMVFQSYALYPSMTVRENISFGLGLRKVPQAEQHQTVQRVADMLQISHLLERKPAQLSGGQRQRVAMGRALARDPALFLFDEPLSNLDAKLRVEMRAEIKRMHQRLGSTIVYVTHDQIEAMTLGDQIAVMKDGLVQQFGTPQEIYDQPANLFVAGFIGSPSMNFIRGRVVQDGDALGLACSTAAGHTVLRLPQRCGVGGHLGQEVIVGIRPENITDERSAHDPAAQRLPCQVELTEPTGPDTLVTFKLNEAIVTARSHPASAARPGEAMTLCVDTSKAVAFNPQTGERLSLPH
ncbi:MAG: ABC transporter ATP-binding protein [Burkholderiaceae bacterium]